jgi:hypothetical protein
MQAVLESLPQVGACITLIIGLIGFFKPRLLTDVLDIKLDSARAVSEIRGVFGGLNLGSSVAALALNEPLIFISLGIAWLFVTLARFWSMIVDKSTLKDTVPALVIDGGLSFLFLSGLIWQ